LNVEWERIEECEARSIQGEVISESPVHVGRMRSDSRHSLASHGHGGSESTTPWGDEHRTPNAERRTPNAEHRTSNVEWKKLKNGREVKKGE
jgi:hypothetical protein